MVRRVVAALLSAVFRTDELTIDRCLSRRSSDSDSSLGVTQLTSAVTDGTQDTMTEAHMTGDSTGTSTAGSTSSSTSAAAIAAISISVVVMIGLSVTAILLVRRQKRRRDRMASRGMPLLAPDDSDMAAIEPHGARRQITTEYPPLSDTISSQLHAGGRAHTSRSGQSPVEQEEHVPLLDTIQESSTPGAVPVAVASTQQPARVVHNRSGSSISWNWPAPGNVTSQARHSSRTGSSRLSISTFPSLVPATQPMPRPTPNSPVQVHEGHSAVIGHIENGPPDTPVLSPARSTPWSPEA